MANKCDQILKTLAGLIPEDAQSEVAAAVTSVFDGLEKEYDKELKEAYDAVDLEKKEIQAKAELGFQQAWDIIADLRDRLEIQKEEHDQELEEGYEEAYQMLQEERAKNDNLEVSLYEDYDKRFHDVKEDMVDQVDRFLCLEADNCTDRLKKELMHDPAFAEHKLAFDKILEVAQNYLSDEDFAHATNSRLEAVAKQMDEQKAQIKILEAKNMRLATDNTRLTEAVKYQQKQLLSETKVADRTERVGKAQKAEGRGQIDTERQVVIGEQQDKSGESVTEQTGNKNTLVERFDKDVFADWRTLAGIKPKSSK